jgi:hypothetical protein
LIGRVQTLHTIHEIGHIFDHLQRNSHHGTGRFPEPIPRLLGEPPQRLS